MTWRKRLQLLVVTKSWRIARFCAADAVGKARHVGDTSLEDMGVTGAVEILFHEIFWSLRKSMCHWLDPVIRIIYC